MRTQFALYKSFDDVYQDLNDKQKIEFIDTLFDVQFLRVKIEDVTFKDVILKHIWNAQKHSLEKSINGYIESQKNSKIKNPFLGCYDDNFLPIQLPSEGNHKEEEEKGEEEVKGKGEEEHSTAVEKISNHSYAIVEIIFHLNSILKTNYKSSSQKTSSLIKARLSDGFTLDDFKQVHMIKYAEWNGTDMQKFLRPETLYGNKFESYLNQKLTLNEKYKAVSNHTGMSALEMLKQQGYAE